MGVPSATAARRHPIGTGAYKSAAAAARRDPDAQVRLALWCEAHGLTAERLKHLSLAVLYDPSNALARGLMGLVAYQGNGNAPKSSAGRSRTTRHIRRSSTIISIAAPARPRRRMPR